MTVAVGAVGYLEGGMFESLHDVYLRVQLHYVNISFGRSVGSEKSRCGLNISF